MSDPQQRSEAEWREQLTPEQFHITREKGTERAFTGEFWNSKEEGTYLCVCCDQPLYDSGAKYDSGSGWPSYWEPVNAEVVSTKADRSLGMSRVEILCSRCGAHLGHRFPDGPPPTGLRHCVNSASLRFKKKGDQG